MRWCGFLLLSVVTSPAFGDHSTETFYTQVERGVVRLERKISGPSGDEYCPVGTAFFVSTEKSELFIVTARHVAVVGDLRARVPTINTANKKTDVIELRLPVDRWVFNKNAGDAKTYPVDVAVMRLGGIADRAIVSFRYCATACPEGEYNQVAQDPAPPDEVLIFGFPSDVGFTLREPRPMARFGIVALTTVDETAFTITDEGQERVLPKGVYAVDAKMIGGNSGGPVVVMNPFQPLRLGGLVTAENQVLDFGLMTPVTQIAETLEQATHTVTSPDTWSTLPASSAPEGPLFGPERNAWLKRCFPSLPAPMSPTLER
jgi:hypothetical protein